MRGVSRRIFLVWCLACALWGPAAQAVEVTVPAGTWIEVTLLETLSTADDRAGTTYEGLLEQEVRVDDKVVLPKGTRVTGRIVEVEPPRWLVRKARMTIRLSHLVLNGERIALRSSEIELAKNRDGDLLAEASAGAKDGADEAEDLASGWTDDEEKIKKMKILGRALGTLTGTGQRHIVVREGKTLPFLLAAPLTLEVATAPPVSKPAPQIAPTPPPKPSPPGDVPQPKPDPDPQPLAPAAVDPQTIVMRDDFCEVYPGSRACDPLPGWPALPFHVGIAISVALWLRYRSFRHATRGTDTSGWLAFAVLSSVAAVNTAWAGHKKKKVPRDAQDGLRHAEVWLALFMVSLPVLSLGSVLASDDLNPLNLHWLAFGGPGVGLCLLGYARSRRRVARAGI